MKLTIRNKGSQRTFRPKPVTFLPNFSGQGGVSYITLEGEDMYFMLEPETLEEVKQLLSEAHIVHHNFKEEPSL